MRVFATLMIDFFNLNSFKATTIPAKSPSTDAIKVEVRETFKDSPTTGSISLYVVKNSLINSNISSPYFAFGTNNDSPNSSLPNPAMSSCPSSERRKSMNS